jgi:hypothetical protein
MRSNSLQSRLDILPVTVPGFVLWMPQPPARLHHRETYERSCVLQKWQTWRVYSLEEIKVNGVGGGAFVSIHAAHKGNVSEHQSGCRKGLSVNVSSPSISRLLRDESMFVVISCWHARTKTRCYIATAAPSVRREIIGITRIGLINFAWSCGLRRGPSTTCWLGSRVRILLRVLMFVCCDCWVFCR